MVFAKNVRRVNSYCHDCNSEIEEGEEVLLKYRDERKDLFVVKCKECFEKDPRLTNFRKCEVYSRVCGYLRPVSQWNIAKQREYKKRKEYKIRK